MSSLETLYGTPKVGGDTLSYCTKCRMDLAHVIVSMVDTRPAKVVCKTCKSQHKYRHGLGVKAPTARSARNPSSKTTVRVAEMWEKKISEKNQSQQKNYSVDQTFLVGDVISHTQFGLGIVEEVRSSGKMMVMFRDSERVMIHGHKAH